MIKQVIWKSDWLVISLFIICFLLLFKLAFPVALDNIVMNIAMSFFPSIAEHPVIHPYWAGACEILMLVLAIYFLLFRCSSINTCMPLIYIGLFIAICIAVEFYLLASQNLWLRLALPSTLFFTGTTFVCFRNFMTPGSNDDQLESDARKAERNYTVGLAFQQQGHLDWAFDKFKTCPLNNSLMGTLYKLGQEYENKHQFKKAISVYTHMSQNDENFRDIKIKKEHLELQIDTAISTIPISDNRKLDPTLSNKKIDLHDQSILGDYQLEKEIGRGATGRIFLAHNLQTKQKVAIKVLPLTDEFDKPEVEDVKQRFFREAETAGQLTHPNIVRIYDTGEFEGLAYIVMEYLTGHNLTPYTRKDNLLSPVMVMGIVYKAAKAMDYAHSKQVIHRDLKPANIMFDLDKKKIILTDFGIARLIDVSRTRTGIVLGTPAYMSPEQLEGSKIDGRSDLFALGVMLFQLLTGELPFKGESLAMLMYMIGNEPHRDILKLRPELAEQYPCLEAIIDKALEKDPEDRFQSGFEMAEALKHCGKN